MTNDSPGTEEFYRAAGAVVVHGGKALVLERPSRKEIRLPKGHQNENEEPPQTALREVEEESGYCDLIIVRDLGTQEVRFTRENRSVRREERFFLAVSQHAEMRHGTAHETQFEPRWMTWEEAIRALTYEPEREWMRRARNAVEAGCLEGDANEE